MIKALMVITMVTGATYEVKLHSMEQCLAERAPVESQNDVASTACIPRTEDKVPSELLSQFMDMFFMLEEQRQFENPCNKNKWKPGEDYFPPNYGKPTS